MRKTLLAFDKVPQFAKTDVAYAIGDPRLTPFYTYPPSLNAFPNAIVEKAKADFPRETLVQVLQEQYSNLPASSKVSDNIAALLRPDVFTVATAHQPSLFLGPLYFLYKALSVLRLAEDASTQTDRHIVPVFVLGSEDHDLDELNHIQLYGKKLVWETDEGGAVGSMPTAGLSNVLAELRTILGDGEAAQALFARIEKNYTQTHTIAEATRAMLHDLLGRFGLVVVDMNHPDLKRCFIPVMRAELLEHPAFRLVSETAAQLNALGFKTQATPREINLFYLQPNSRERIVREGNLYKVLNTDLQFSQEDLLKHLEAHPEHFSPNVVLRPLYQELVLPNLAYVGGGGELAYWLERKTLFAHFQVPLPMLVRRHSILWLDRDSIKKMVKANLTVPRLFDDTDSLVRHFVESNADAEVQLTAEITDLSAVYERLAQKALAVDPTLEKAVRADGVKAVAALEQWESRLVRAEKQKHEVTLNQIRALKEKLFPANGLQERYDNFMPYILKYGDAWLDTLYEQMAAFDPGIVVLEDL